MKEILMQPIGYVHNNVECKKDVAWAVVDEFYERI